MAMIDLDYDSDILKKSVHMEIILPSDDGWTDTEMPYSTLYFLTDYGWGSRETASLLSFRLQSMLNGIAVVIVEGENSFYVDELEEGKAYSEFVCTEMLEVTREILPLSDRSEDTYIGGTGVGGYGAFYNGMKEKGSFSKIALISPVLDLYQNKNKRYTKSRLDKVFGSSERFYQSKEWYQALMKEEHEGVFVYCCREGGDLLACERHLAAMFRFLRCKEEDYEKEGSN